VDNDFGLANKADNPHLPLAFRPGNTKRVQSRLPVQKKRPAIVYMHPYEIDLENKKFDLSPLSFVQKFKAMKFHLLQLRDRKTVAKKLVKLLYDFEFATLSEVIDKTFEK